MLGLISPVNDAIGQDFAGEQAEDEGPGEGEAEEEPQEQEQEGGQAAGHRHCEVHRRVHGKREADSGVVQPGCVQHELRKSGCAAGYVQENRKKLLLYRERRRRGVTANG